MIEPPKSQVWNLEPCAVVVDRLFTHLISSEHELRIEVDFDGTMYLSTFNLTAHWLDSFQRTDGQRAK